MLQHGVWGTHLEMKALLHYFKCQFTCCTQCGASFSWNITAPISLDIAKVPHIIDEVAQLKNISHIEVYCHENHYDAIVLLRGKTCIEVQYDPLVITISDFMNIVRLFYIPCHELTFQMQNEYKSELSTVGQVMR